MDRLTGRRCAALLAVLSLGLAGCSESDEDPQRASASPTPSTTTPTFSPSAPEPTTDSPPRLLRNPRFHEWEVPAGAGPHDVAPGRGGVVWYTGQGSGDMGVLDPTTGRVEVIPLPAGAAPHGVIVDDRGHAWVTDGGLNAIVKVDHRTLRTTVHQLPGSSYANLNTATFAGDGTLWFTGQEGVHGRLDVGSGELAVFASPRGTGPYGIATTPRGDVWIASLAGSYIARVRSRHGTLEVVDVPTPAGGARRVWSDSSGALWVTEWYAGKLARYDPETRRWKEWQLPGDDPQPYAVYVDDADQVWVTDFGADALVRFDPVKERFRTFPWPTPGAEVRQLLGRPGEVWGAGSGTDTIIVLRTR